MRRETGTYTKGLTSPPYCLSSQSLNLLLLKLFGQNLKPDERFRKWYFLAAITKTWGQGITACRNENMTNCFELPDYLTKQCWWSGVKQILEITFQSRINNTDEPMLRG